MSRRSNGGLPPEDAALWAHVTRSITRLPAKRTALPQHEAKEAAPKRSPAAAHAQAHARPMPPPPTVRRAPLPQPQPAVDPRKARRIARGRDAIDARIDLHGMRQAEAHAALRRFLQRAYHDGCRMVLVITGKGRETADERHAPFDMFQDRDRGVLRRNVPRWLAEPELVGIVVGYTGAHVKHGGDGAFYVQLRNRDKHRD